LITFKEGDHARDRHALLGHPDGAEAALAMWLAQLVGADLVAFLLGVGFLEFLRAEGAAVVIAEEGIGAFSLDEQALDFEVEFGVVAAGLGEESLALGWLQLAGLDEEVLGLGVHDTDPVVWHLIMESVLVGSGVENQRIGGAAAPARGLQAAGCSRCARDRAVQALRSAT
jgi:hypothetical protein